MSPNQADFRLGTRFRQRNGVRRTRPLPAGRSPRLPVRSHGSAPTAEARVAPVRQSRDFPPQRFRSTAVRVSPALYAAPSPPTRGVPRPGPAPPRPAPPPAPHGRRCGSGCAPAEFRVSRHLPLGRVAHHAGPHHVQVDVHDARARCSPVSTAVAWYWSSQNAPLATVVGLSRAPFDELHARGDLALVPVADEEMDVIGGDRVVEHAQPEPPPRFVEPARQRRRSRANFSRNRRWWHRWVRCQT